VEHSGAPLGNPVAIAVVLKKNCYFSLDSWEGAFRYTYKTGSALVRDAITLESLDRDRGYGLYAMISLAALNRKFVAVNGHRIRQNAKTILTNAPVWKTAVGHCATQWPST
jgi:hypothetical protein